MANYKLHSKCENNTWFHFREDMDSLMQSFTISYLWDGTVVLSGDMGDLMWKRSSHGYGNMLDYGFPSKDTNIDYFDEKVILPKSNKEYDLDLAFKNLIEFLEDNEYEDLIKEVKDKEYFFPYSEEKFIDYLNDLDLDDCELYNLGDRYNHVFIYRFQMLQSVSEIILNEVRK